LSGIFALGEKNFDRTHAILAGLVFVGAFIVYALTTQHSVPFWDCGEHIACSASLGVPHPPGFALMALIGRLFSILPLGNDIAHRINYFSVITSAFTAFFAYLLTVKIVSYFFRGETENRLNRFILFAGGVTGGFFVALGQSNWFSSVEAEIYCVSMALAVMLVYFSILYFEQRGTFSATRLLIMFFYLSVLGIGFSQMAFLVVPVCAIAFILKREATAKDWLIVSSSLILELLLIIAFATVFGGNGGPKAFYLATAFVILGLLVLMYHKVNWIIMFAIGAVCSSIVAFGIFLLIAPIALGLLLIVGLLHLKWSSVMRYAALVLIGLACSVTLWLEWDLTVYLVGVVAFVLIGAALLSSVSPDRRLQMHWKSAAAIVFLSLIGFSVNIYLPVRSSQEPRINENMPSRDYRTFVAGLDRKQYGSESYFDRMFHRRSSWEHQFGRHPNMGFWSYFEKQWSHGGVSFLPWLALGILGFIVAIRKRIEIGMPFLAVFLLCSIGIILYMNFADGTRYDFQTGDAYLEVRDRDYFFTSAFVFFGIAMGLGVSGLLQIIRDRFATGSPQLGTKLVYGLGILCLCLPSVALAVNYHQNDRSDNFLAYTYAKNLLDSCEQNAIIFTSGDNDTFPVWALQEAYGYRLDVRVVNLSLLNTDWYVYEMKTKYGVPISLEKDQILWNVYKGSNGGEFSRPDSMFVDRPRKRRAYMIPSMLDGRVVKVQDMLVDDIVLENRWQSPIYFSSPPYSESPLKLRDHMVAVGMLYRLDRDNTMGGIDIEKSYDLYMNKYQFPGLSNGKMYRDENMTGIYIGIGIPTYRLFSELMKKADTTRALALMDHMIKIYPEYWQSYQLLSDFYEAKGDSAKAIAQWQMVHDTLDSFHKANPDNLLFLQDLGWTSIELGKRKKDQMLIDQGIAYLKAGFEGNKNSAFAFRKYVMALNEQRKYAEMQAAAKEFTEYKINLGDPAAQQILGIQGSPNMPSPDEQ
jgi:hypothetical protein